MGGRNRSANEGGPTLGARVLMNEIEKLARAKHLVGHGVAYKMNDRGEHVAALIFPPQPP